MMLGLVHDRHFLAAGGDGMREGRIPAIADCPDALLTPEAMADRVRVVVDLDVVLVTYV